MRCEKLILSLLVVLFCSSENSFAQNKQIDSLKLVLSRLKEDSIKVKTLIDLSWQFKIIAEFNTAIKYAEEALELAQQLKYRKGEGDIYRRLGRYYQNINDLEKAREKLYAAIRIREETGEQSNSDEHWDDRSIAVIYTEISSTYTIEDNYPEAIKCSLTALELYEKAGNITGISNVYSQLAGIYFNYSDYKTSHNYASLSLKLKQELNNKSSIAYAFLAQGEIETEMGMDALAKENILAALAIFEELKDPRGIFGVDRCLAKLYLEQGKKALIERNLILANEKFRIAEAKSLSALEYNNEDGDYVSLAYVYYFLGEIYKGLRQFSKAKLYLEKSNTLAVSTKNKYTAKLSFFGLYQLDSIKENDKEAIENYKKYIIYRDSIVNNVNTAKLASSKLQYDFTKKEDSLKQEHTLTQVKLEAEQKQKYFYWTGLLLMTLLAFLVFRNFRNQKKINQLADETHEREKAELELHSLRAQLNPHFMFNSLNAIQELILLEKNENAQSYLARFAKLLRMLLENADRPFIPLQRELDFLQLYLSLENLRIADLQHSITVDPLINTEQMAIPNMILQPYIENAIWHGLAHKTNDKRLEIRITRPNGFVQYEIEDNGVGRVKAAELKSLFRKEHKSKGMELLSRRFKLLAKEYGSDIRAEYKDVLNENGIAGTRVTIRVPLEFSHEIVNTVS